MIIITILGVLVNGITVAVQLNKLDDSVEEGLGGVMSMYSDGALSKVSIMMPQLCKISAGWTQCSIQ